MIDRLETMLLRIVSRLGLFDIDTIRWWQDAEEQANAATRQIQQRHNIVEAAYLQQRRKESRNA